MTKLDERMIAKLNALLDEIFKDVPHGGDHESRKQVAKKLMQGVRKGSLTPDGLTAIAREALQQSSTRRSA